MQNSGIYGYENGIQNENEIMNAINGKKFSELSEHLKYVVKEMFNSIRGEDLIKVEKVPGFAKPDLKFTVLDESHYLSIKFGNSSQLHCEDIDVFVKWLKDNDFSDHIIECFKKYHYADGTLDGTGKKRLGQQEAMEVYQSEVDELNAAFNSNRFLVRDLAKRVIFEGNDPSKPKADFIYHGDIEEGKICPMDTVLNYFKLKRSDKLFTPHFSRILVRPYARYLNNQDTNPDKRHKVVFEWVRMKWDLEFMKHWRY